MSSSVGSFSFARLSLSFTDLVTEDIPRDVRLFVFRKW